MEQPTEGVKAKLVRLTTSDWRGIIALALIVLYYFRSDALLAGALIAIASFYFGERAGR